ncbi:hypothetical protein ACIRL3_24380 [Streptomyces sp. NPDC102384]|uniref:hypothetical protein n=1 Tax=Streptomyces sp. NPDC102384 TaxID=3366166 RepID=UPI0037F32803
MTPVEPSSAQSTEESGQVWSRLFPYRAVLAVDARNFSAHTSTEMQQINADIQTLLDRALFGVGLSGQWERRSFGQHTGDGYVAGLDTQVLPALVGCFPDALREELWSLRQERPGRSPLQLRVSIHVGPLPDSGLGVPMVHTHRLLDDQALRDLLSRADPEVTNTAVIISERVYEDVFESGCQTGHAVPSQFKGRFVRVKTFERPARLHVPGLDWGLADSSIFDVPGDAAGQSGVGADVPPAGPPAPPAAGGVTFHQNGSGNGAVQGLTNHVHNDFRGQS